MAYRTKGEITADIKASKERLISYLSKCFDVRAALMKSDLNRVESKLTDDKFELKTAKATGITGMIMAIAGGCFTAIAIVASIAAMTFTPGIFAFGLFAVGLGTFVKIRSDKKRKKLEEKIKNKKVLTRDESDKLRQQLHTYEKMAQAEEANLRNLEAEYCGAPQQKVSTLKNLRTTSNFVDQRNYYER